MTLEQEMKLWEERSNDKFGTMLKSLKKATNDYFLEEENEFAIKSTPISKLTSIYAVDGDRKYVYKRAYSICENYDLLQFENVSNILKAMKKLSEMNKMDY